MMGTLESSEFRRVLGHYPTGVCVVTSISDAGPVGMVVGSFTSVSLDPPLVAFLPDRRSASWPRIAATGRFCVNVLGERQQDVCRVFSSKASNRFTGISYRLSSSGLPIIDGVVAWIDCELHAVHEAGDHYIVIGIVRELDVLEAGSPLVFVRGAYGTISPCSTPEWSERSAA